MRRVARMCDGYRVRALARPVLAVAVLLGVLACSPSSPGPEPSVSAQPLTPAGLAAALSDAELVGQVLMPDLSLADAPETATAMMEVYQPGGVILMGNGTAAQVRAFTEALQAATAPLHGQQLLFGPETEVVTGIADTDYHRVAEGFGAFGQRVERLSEVAPAIRAALDHGGPACVNLAVSGEVAHPVTAAMLGVVGMGGTVLPYYDNVPGPDSGPMEPGGMEPGAVDPGGAS